MRKGDQALNQMTPGDEAGKRTAVEMCEVGLDQARSDSTKIEAARPIGKTLTNSSGGIRSASRWLSVRHQLDKVGRPAPTAPAIFTRRTASRRPCQPLAR